MKLSITYLIAIMGCLSGLGVIAQDTTATGYFNRASREYIKEDKLTAMKTLDEALRIHPGDARLLRLAEELLKEEEQQQQEEQEQQEENGGDQDDREDDAPENGEDPKEEKDDEGKKDQEQDRQQRPDEKGERKPETIAPHDARRMLDALDRQEKEVQEKVRARQRPASRIPIEKDW